ncbi:MAG: type II toxin-antitoxin system RelE family toxin [Thermodesulfobacteriota bacterium]
MAWTVKFSGKAAKQAGKLPARIRERLDALRMEIAFAGPVQPAMPHFGRLKGWPGEAYHCHLNKGRPTYVAVWTVEDRVVRLVEVTYVGTHEKAPY